MRENVGQFIRAISARRPEWQATIAWMLRSWLHPADADARWEQEAESDDQPRRP